MRVAVAVYSHEGCTFNPRPTELDAFAARCLIYGDDLITNPPPQAGFLKGFVDTIPTLAPAVELVPSIAARTTNGGRVSKATFTHIRDAILTGIADAGALDAIALCLHGASAVEDDDDPEGHILAAVRAIVGDELPIGVALDHHANVTAAMVDHASFLVGDRYQPHDKDDTGRLLAELLVKVVDGDIDPVMAFRKLPLISHQEQYLTIKPPMKTWFARARELEDAGTAVVSASTFPMQPWLDVSEGGYGVVVVTDGDTAAAEAAADELAELAWSLRADLQATTSLPPDETVAEVARLDGFVVVSDTGDSVGGGGGGDSTSLLSALLAHGGPRVLLPMVHPPIGDLARRVQVGDELTIEVGGAITGWFEPVEVTGIVRAVDLDYTAPVPTPIKHPISGRPLAFHRSLVCGATVALEVRNVLLVISETPGPAGRDPVHFTGLGIDVTDYDAVVLKTASNFQHWATDLTTNVVRADTPGPTQSDMAGLPWQRIPRPIYPLDPLGDWR